MRKAIKNGRKLTMWRRKSSEQKPPQNENTHTCKIKQRNKNKQENKKLTYQL